MWRLHWLRTIDLFVELCHVIGVTNPCLPRAKSSDWKPQIGQFQHGKYWIGHVLTEVFVHSPWWSPEGSRRNSQPIPLRNLGAPTDSRRSCGTPWLRSIDLRWPGVWGKRSQESEVGCSKSWWLRFTRLLGLHLCYNLPLDEKHKKLKHSEVESDIG